MSEITEEISIDIGESDHEYNEQKDLAGKRIDSITQIQDRLRNHISNLETINTVLEANANRTKDPQEKLKLLKSMSYNYDRLIKMYEVYQQYEQVIQRYHSNVVDIVSKKYHTVVDISRIKRGSTSIDFFTKLNEFVATNNRDEINSLIQIDDENYQL